MLENKTILITGAAGILGTEFTQCLLSNGARVIAVDRANLDQLGKNDRLELFEADIADEKSIQQISQKLGSGLTLDGIVNAAATKTSDFFAPLEKFSTDQWDQVFSVNVKGAFLVTRVFLPLLSRSSSIVNVASIYGVVGADQRIYEGAEHEQFGQINTPLVYSASKGAVISMTRHLAAELAPRGIRVNCLSPGGVRSGQNEAFQRNYSQRVPLGRMAEKNEVADALLFLLSEKSSYVNGHNLIVDGGWCTW